jgi:replicative DNA helicase
MLSRRAFLATAAGSTLLASAAPVSSAACAKPLTYGVAPPDEPEFTPLGFAEFDEDFGGAPVGALTAVCGQPGMGCTALLLSAALKWTGDRGLRVVYLDVSGSGAKLYSRLLSMEAEIDVFALRRGSLSPREARRVRDAAARMRSWPLAVRVAPSWSVAEISSAAGTGADDIDVLVVDGMEHLADTAERAVWKLARLAEELEIPVLLAAGMAPLERADPRPMIFDIPNAIRRHAATIVAVHRPEYFFGPDVQEDPERYRTALHVLRSANGVVGAPAVAFDSSTGRFYDAPAFEPRQTRMTSG